MHGLAALGLDLVDRVVLPQVPAQPFDPKLVGDVAPRDEEVPPAAHEIRRVENELGLVDHVAKRFAGLRRPIVRVVERVEQLRLRRRSPSRARLEVLPEECAIGVRLEVARAPRHGRLDDLVAHHQETVPRTGRAEARRAPEGRLDASREVHWIRPPDLHALGLEDVNELVELLLGGLPEQPRIAHSAHEAVDPRHAPGHVEGHDRMTGGNRRPLEAAHDDLFERVPLVVGVDRTNGVASFRDRLSHSMRTPASLPAPTRSRLGSDRARRRHREAPSSARRPDVAPLFSQLDPLRQAPRSGDPAGLLPGPPPG